jgi:hypothetical protein
VLLNIKLYVNSLDAPDAHFDYSSLFSDAQVEKVGNPPPPLPKRMCKLNLMDIFGFSLRNCK